jgi:hypothetical protein
MKSRAFTLTEMLTALAVGMFVLNIAFASFSFTQKFIRKTEVLGAKNDCAQALMLWVQSGRAKAGVPFPNTAQFRGVMGRIDNTNGAADYYDLIVYTEVTATAAPDVGGRLIQTSGAHGLLVGMSVDVVKLSDGSLEPSPSTVVSLKGSNSAVITNSSTDVVKIRPILDRLCVPKVEN